MRDRTVLRMVLVKILKMVYRFSASGYFRRPRLKLYYLNLKFPTNKNR